MESMSDTELVVTEAGACELELEITEHSAGSLASTVMPTLGLADVGDRVLDGADDFCDLGDLGTPEEEASSRCCNVSPCRRAGECVREGECSRVLRDPSLRVGECPLRCRGPVDGELERPRRRSASLPREGE